MLLPLLPPANNAPEMLLPSEKYCLIEPVLSSQAEPMPGWAFDETGFMDFSSSSDADSSQTVYAESDSLVVENERGALANEFTDLVRRWNEETFGLSSLTKIYAHPAYQRIIAMGVAGLPHVLRELEGKGGRWFYALKFMAGQEGADVAATAANCDYETARAIWLEWGYQNNYL